MKTSLSLLLFVSISLPFISQTNQTEDSTNKDCEDFAESLGSCLAEGSSPIVNTTHGPIQGSILQSFGNRSFLAYRGVPYAKPPVGNLRFANPELPEPWNETLQTVEYPPRCIQRNPLWSLDPPIEGDEDCLYLNVFVPENCTGKGTELLPVFVSFHWSGYFAGSGDDGYFDPIYFMDHDAVLVTLNNRLGPFGFLSTLDDEAPGNLGLKDQQVALHWVQDNIETFGGNKSLVTIMGQSGGGGNVQMHMISLTSNGLYSRAISQSATALGAWAYSTNELQLNYTYTQAGLVNCSHAISNHSELIACLRNVSADLLLQTQDSFKVFYTWPYNVWALISETKTERNPTPFLTQPIETAVRAGDFQKVPYLLGVVKYEGLLESSVLFTVDEVTAALADDFESATTLLQGLSLVTNDTSSLYTEVAEFFWGGGDSLDIDNDTWRDGYTNALGDRAVTISVYQAITLQLAVSNQPIYLYNMDYVGKDTYAKAFSTEPEKYNRSWGICHCDDLLYQFRAKQFFGVLTEPGDIELSNTWLSLWINFGKYGAPNPPENTILEGIDWEPLSVNFTSDGWIVNDDIRLLNVTGNYTTGPQFKIDSGFYKERMEFWQNTTGLEK